MKGRKNENNNITNNISYECKSFRTIASNGYNIRGRICIIKRWDQNRVPKYGSNKPPLIIVQGAMGVIVNYHEFAKALSHDFTVYVPERRGRPLSPKEYTPAHTIEKDVEDVSCVINVSGASYVFGLSSGALVTLEAIKVLPFIKKAAVYEPPFYVKSPVPVKKIYRVFTLISEGKTSSSLAHVFKIVKVGPKVFNYVPMPMLKLMTKAYIKSDDKQQNSRYPKVSSLVPTMRFDFTDVLQRSGCTGPL